MDTNVFREPTIEEDGFLWKVVHASHIATENSASVTLQLTPEGTRNPYADQTVVTDSARRPWLAHCRTGDYLYYNFKEFLRARSQDGKICIRDETPA